MAVNSGDKPSDVDRTRTEHDLRTRQHQRFGLLLLAILLVGLAIRYLWRAAV